MQAAHFFRRFFQFFSFFFTLAAYWCCCCFFSSSSLMPFNEHVQRAKYHFKEIHKTAPYVIDKQITQLYKDSLCCVVSSYFVSLSLRLIVVLGLLLGFVEIAKCVCYTLFPLLVIYLYLSISFLLFIHSLIFRLFCIL